ncbi:granzyme-like protein 1 isoform X2 [Hyperolius riggenbachi]|uniref:granzyme-like protein 1 isoform X2 n=1 Tax=Hyperolius riggenbachi TaxID=752182 RepID=UPI0035A2DE97
MGLIIFFLVACCILSISADGIFGGREVSPHSMPYMAYLTFYTQNRQLSRCGGVLISEDIVLTAAHCNGTEMTVRLGAHNVEEKEISTQEIKVCKIFPHFKYKAGIDSSDIMMLKLKNRVVPNRFVLPLPIVRSKKYEIPTPGSYCTTAGWGKFRTRSDQLSSKLQKVDLKLVSREECSKFFNNINVKEFICAGDPMEKDKATLAVLCSVAKIFKAFTMGHEMTNHPLVCTQTSLLTSTGSQKTCGKSSAKNK